MNFHASVLAGLYVAWFPCEIMCPGGQAVKWGTLTTAYSPQSPSFLQNSQRSLRQNIYLNSWGLELMEPGVQRIKHRFIKALRRRKEGALHSEYQTQSCRQWPLPGSRAKHTPADRGPETSGMGKWASFVCMPSTTSCNLAMPQFPPLRN